MNRVIEVLVNVLKGGAGSGNFGHAGIPGQQGGSASGGSGRAAITINDSPGRGVQGVAASAFSGAQVTPTATGVGVTVMGSHDDVKAGMARLGMIETAQGRYINTTPDANGVQLSGTVNIIAGNPSRGMFTITLTPSKS